MDCYPPQPVSVLGPAPTLSPSFDWLRVFSSQTFSHINTPTFSTLVILTDLSMKMEQTECSETLAYKIQTPGHYPEENRQLQRNWRSWICHTVFLILLVWKLETVTDMMSRVFCVCRQQCHLLECGLFCGPYDCTYCWQWHTYILCYVCMIQSCFFCFTDSLPLTSHL